jgi:phosphatidylserine decarboxylase
MTIHKEGFRLITIFFILLLAVNLIVYYFAEATPLITIPLGIASFGFWLLILWFFRLPKRIVVPADNQVLAPADGKIVAIEETRENEYFNDNRIQVSIFMSPLDVHVNCYPVSGKVVYYKYHKGNYLVAWHPKSSTDNERTTIVLETDEGSELLVRQIAGAVARRVVCYSEINNRVVQGDQLGFIKFGSRVDLFLPLNAKINVELNQKVQANKTVIAYLE